MTPPSKSSGDTRWNLMFRELKREISQPTEEHPAARVRRESDLKAVIMKIRKEQLAALKSTFPSAKDVIARMLEIGWLQIIPLESAAGEDPPRIYLLDMEATEEDLPDAWELMQGFKSGGVLCYFGAVAFHELTTQEPAFYHIANLRPPGARVESAEIQPAGESGTAGRTRDPLGTLEFRFQGLPCYTTGRDTTTIPGIQTRDYGPRTQLRITTLEQTMLDTLWQPLKCGGESVVFEAWERGVQRWNPERMAKHLAAINRPDWERRVGAMLSLLGVETDGSLQGLLATRKETLRQSMDHQHLPLMPGLPASRLLTEWGILTP
ncbi:MAG: type IV toxin-antitoxin system AbiEi family antitoxin domain-containing protein [Luteolibacter sp.]